MRTKRLWTLGLLVLVMAWVVAGQPSQNWTHFVRIGGHGLTGGNADEIVRSAAETHVFGIETDNDITGRYESFLDPAAKLEAIRAVAAKAHAAGNRAFVYIAGTECITANADKTTRTLFKEHPDWVQRKLTGEPAVFTGGAAFWIRKGDEDVWISPYAIEWRKLYMRRVREIAATGIDGVYVDIPYWMTHFDGWEDSWASFDGYTVAAFKAATGLDAKKDIKLGDFSDPGFLRWIDFRIETLTEFVAEIDRNVKQANPNCMTIPEIYPGIEEAAVRVGSDVYEMYRVVDAIAHEYEFGGNTTAASKTPLEWFHYMTGMYTFRAFAEGKASWMLSYSWDGEKGVDAKEAMQNLFAAQVMAGTNPWDARGHVMSGSNDMATRKGIFGWIAAHERRFYRPRSPISPVGVYFSPRTRNYFPKEFMESYLGTMALLLQSHLEFQIVTPRTLGAFQGGVLVLPDVRCLGDGEADGLRARLKTGKRVLVTGETGKYNLRREPQAQTIVQKIRPQAGLGFAVECPGRRYSALLAEGFDSLAVCGDYRKARFQVFRESFAAQLKDLNYKPAVGIEASPFAAAQIALVDGKIHVFFANFRGLKGKENAVQTPERDVRISFPESAGARVYALPYLGEAREVKAERVRGKLTCVIPEIGKGTVVWVE